jgi:hypothetical protein
LLINLNRGIFSNFGKYIVKLLLATIILFTATLSFTAACNRSELPSASPQYIQRGREVLEHYQLYSERLEIYYKSLLGALQAKIPALVPLVKAPEPPRHGYQVLPRIIASLKPAPAQIHLRPASYSWAWTEELIEKQLKKVTNSEAELRDAGRPGYERTNIHEKLAREFSELRESQRNIDAHIQYNRLWQAAIAADRAGYDHQTVLYGLALRRWAIAKEMNALAKAIYPFQYAREVISELGQRERVLGRSIGKSIDRLNLPPFVHISRNGSIWIIRVPFYTDIDDNNFVELIKEQIEKTWRLRDGKEEFRVELAISYVSSNELYAGSRPPARGDPIDLPQHIARFRPDGAVLTTGALTTHYYQHAIVLGSEDISSPVLAHEFGHVLGFSDNYIRGYKDLGENGFQIMEIVADPDDLMGDPQSGSVLRRHFEQILEACSERKARV